MPIAGEAAFFLGPEARNEILSIVQRDAIWQLAIYDLNGQNLGLLDYTYAQQPRESWRYIPHPVTFQDGSVLLLYDYKERSNPFSAVFNGLDPEKRGTGTQLDSSWEVVLALIDPQRSSFTALKVTDAYGEPA